MAMRGIMLRIRWNLVRSVPVAVDDGTNVWLIFSLLGFQRA
jgi:hypothetical protein